MVTDVALSNESRRTEEEARANGVKNEIDVCPCYEESWHCVSVETREDMYQLYNEKIPWGDWALSTVCRKTPRSDQEG